MSNTWPDFLPPPQLEGYELQRQKNKSRTDMTAGPARVRKRFTAFPTNITQVWVLTQKEFGMLEWWYDNTIDSGAAWFDAPQKNGTGRVVVQCRFVDDYKAKPISATDWQVTATLEVYAMPRGKLLDFWPLGQPTLDLDFLTKTYGVAG